MLQVDCFPFLMVVTLLIADFPGLASLSIPLSGKADLELLTNFSPVSFESISAMTAIVCCLGGAWL